MKKLIVLVVVAACGGNRDHGLTDIAVTDSGGFEGDPDCSVLTQTGCGTGEKCTWIHDTDGNIEVDPPVDPLGHIGCAPVGTVANGAKCTFEAATAGGADNCIGGDFCDSNTNDPMGGGVCQTICDNNTGGAPMCAGAQACVTFEGVFAADGATSTPAGICQPACNPLDDNQFLGSGSNVVPLKTGSACGSSGAIGCYGFPADGSGAPPPTHYICAGPAHGYTGTLETGTLVHRSPVPTNEQFLNSCAPGYNLGVFVDSQGSMQVDCFAFCAPVNSFMGATATAASGPNGGATAAGHSHRCNDTDARGTFTVPNTTAPFTNGEHCVYDWFFEVDETSQLLHLSPYSDTVGVCIDHSKYEFDSDGDGTPDKPWPPCLTIPATTTGSNDPLFAGDFGCVDHTKANSDGTAIGTAPGAHSPAVDADGFSRFQHPHIRSMGPAKIFKVIH